MLKSEHQMNQRIIHAAYTFCVSINPNDILLIIQKKYWKYTAHTVIMRV